MKNKRILITLSTFCEMDSTPRKMLEQSEFEVVENKSGKRMNSDEILLLGTDWVGIVAAVESYDSKLLSKLTSLRCISRVGVGIDNIDLAYAKNKNITIRNTPDAPTQAVAEMTIAQIFCLLRKISYHDALMKQKIWEKQFGNQIKGKTLGIIGVGRIGRCVAENMAHFGVSLLGTDIVKDADWAKKVGLEYCSIDDLLKRADIISVHTSVMQQVKPLLGKEEISKMKKGVCLINTSRGNMVDIDALYTALKNGDIACAGLDVFPEEPYAGKLIELENTVLTPHIATLTIEARSQMETEAVKNLLEELRR